MNAPASSAEIRHDPHPAPCSLAVHRPLPLPGSTPRQRSPKLTSPAPRPATPASAPSKERGPRRARARSAAPRRPGRLSGAGLCRAGSPASAVMPSIRALQKVLDLPRGDHVRGSCRWRTRRRGAARPSLDRRGHPGLSPGYASTAPCRAEIRGRHGFWFLRFCLRAARPAPSAGSSSLPSVSLIPPRRGNERVPSSRRPSPSNVLVHSPGPVEVR